MPARKPSRVARGYLIDPKEKTIVHIHHDTRDYREIYKFIECEPSPFTIIRLPYDDVVFVDDEGLLKEPRYFFNIEGYPQPIAGKGLVLGTDSDGETVSAKITFQDLKNAISFSEHSVVDMVTTSGPGWIKTTPVFGPPTTEKSNEKD